MKNRFDQDRTTRDIALFDTIANQYLRKDMYPPSRNARKLRLMQTMNVIAIESSRMDILEVGCGSGFAADYLQGYYRTFTGIDYSNNLIELASKTHQLNDVFFESADLFEYPANKQFDVIFMIGVLHHMPDIEGAMLKCRSLLKPGGYIIVNEPQPANYCIHLLRKVRAKVDKGYSEEQEELAREKLLQLFARTDLEQIGYQPQGLFSTPFAEVMLKPQIITNIISAFACLADRIIERHLSKYIKDLTWNVIVYGKKPQ